MFKIYEKKKPDYMTYAAIIGTIGSYFGTIFFVNYLDLNEIFVLATVIVPAFVYNAIVNSNHRTRDENNAAE